MPSRISDALPLPQSVPDSVAEKPTRASATIAQVRKDDVFSPLRLTASQANVREARTRAGNAAGPMTVASVASHPVLGESRPRSSGERMDALERDPLRLFRDGPRDTATAPRYAEGVERLATFLRRAQAKNDASGAAGMGPSNGTGKPLPASSRTLVANGGASFARQHAAQRPSHYYAGAYAAPGFMAYGYPQYVRPTWNGSGYHSRTFGAGQLFGFSYGFGRTAHGGGMHVGFHYNGRFHTLHVGLQPTTSQPFFMTLNSGYTYGAPPYAPYAGGRYNHNPAAWHPGHAYGYACPHAPYSATPRPFTGRGGQGSFTGSPQAPGGIPHEHRWQGAGRANQGSGAQHAGGTAGQGTSRPDSARSHTAQAVDQTPREGFRHWHEVLGVPHDRATRESVRARYRKDALRLHPDKPGGSKAAFQELQWAYTVAMGVLDARERGEQVPELSQTS
jgi:hypothetical protein